MTEAEKLAERILFGGLAFRWAKEAPSETQPEPDDHDETRTRSGGYYGLQIASSPLSHREAAELADQIWASKMGRPSSTRSRSAAAKLADRILGGG